MADTKPERSDAAANRASILEAAQRLLRDEGYAAISIDRIAAEAGVGKGTVFRRFGDRAGLMAVLLDANMRAFQDAFLNGPPPLGPGAPPEQRLCAFVDGLLLLLDEDIEIALAAEHAARPAGGAIDGALTLHVRSLVAAIDADLDADAVATLLVAACGARTVLRLRARGHDLHAQQAAARALLRGLVGSAAPLSPG